MLSVLFHLQRLEHVEEGAVRPTGSIDSRNTIALGDACARILGSLQGMRCSNLKSFEKAGTSLHFRGILMARTAKSRTQFALCYSPRRLHLVKRAPTLLKYVLHGIHNPLLLRILKQG